MNPQDDACFRCAAIGALLGMASMAVIVAIANAWDDPVPVWTSDEGGQAGWLYQLNPEHPEDGYILQRGDGTQEHIVPTDPPRRGYLGRPPWEQQLEQQTQ